MWEQIRANQTRSAVLVFSMAALLLIIGYFLGMLLLDSAIAGLVIALVVWVFMGLIAYYQGDSILLSVSRARKISHDDNPRLFNVVEEMKIASGLEKMPDIYIIDDPALNAFATGRDPNKASVAITSGLLQKLNRDELQGVIGHEIAHIKNRDVLLMALAAIFLGTIVILAWYATRLLFFRAAFGGRRSSGGGGAAQLIILAVGLILIILAPIAARLMYFAISRKREYLADASSALYTRYPEGLASALEKLAKSNTRVKTANRATAPMYIINPFQKKALSADQLLSTHPPLAERIRILRSMAGASYSDYEQAYEQSRGGAKVIPGSALAASASVGLRGPSPEEPPGEPGTGEVKRAREVSDMMWRKSDYQTIDCECGARLRIPSALGRASVRCPRCNRSHKT